MPQPPSATVTPQPPQSQQIATHYIQKKVYIITQNHHHCLPQLANQNPTTESINPHPPLSHPDQPNHQNQNPPKSIKTHEIKPTYIKSQNPLQSSHCSLATPSTAKGEEEFACVGWEKTRKRKAKRERTLWRWDFLFYNSVIVSCYRWQLILVVC